MNKNQTRNICINFDADDASAIGQAQKLFTNEKVKHDLNIIKAHFVFLVSIITKMQSGKTAIKDAIDWMDEVESRIGSIKNQSLNAAPTN